MRAAKVTHQSNLVLVNAAVEQSTRAKGMQTAMASFVGLEEDQLQDAKEKHEDGMPTFAWLEVEKLENPGDPYYDPDYGPDQLYGPYPYDAVWGVEEQCEGSRWKVDRKQGDEEVNFTKEDLRSVETYLWGSTGSTHPPTGGEAQASLRREMWRDQDEIQGEEETNFTEADMYNVMQSVEQYLDGERCRLMGNRMGNLHPTAIGGKHRKH